jgi:hypothetical protein
VLFLEQELYMPLVAVADVTTLLMHFLPVEVELRTEQAMAEDLQEARSEQYKQQPEEPIEVAAVAAQVILLRIHPAQVARVWW